ncbi:MAG: hypothetical protein M4579_000162 [Chaenotheca gracillima]|nr:MAG: hypothetical protein M4579_000162 [Chaenotheca gracillima]
MPPSLSSVGRTLPSRCPQCDLRSISLMRSFSSSSATQAVRPESPRYIEIPQPKQTRPTPKPKIKGTLPVPRNLFPQRSPEKSTSEYLERTTPEPKSPQLSEEASKPPGGDPRQADYIEWKRRLAASRRQNFRTSIKELYERSQKSAKYVAARSEQRRREREALVSQPPREDDRLTSPSITASMRQLQGGAPPDPHRAERVVAKTARYHQKLAERDAERRDSTHTLYMHARNFITTEAKLDDTIDDVFRLQPPAWDSNRMGGENIWNLGAPESVQELLARMGRQDPAKSSTLMEVENASHLLDQRIKKIAEELTGGKM